MPGLAVFLASVLWKKKLHLITDVLLAGQSITEPALGSAGLLVGFQLEELRLGARRCFWNVQNPLITRGHGCHTLATISSST